MCSYRFTSSAFPFSVHVNLVLDSFGFRLSVQGLGFRLGSGIMM